MTYLIMTKYGPNLKHMLRKHKKKRFSIKTSIEIGLQMLERFKDLHGLGYLHLDLSPDNIILGSSNFRKSESSQLLLIGFCIAKRCFDAFGQHIDPSDQPVPFNGNLLFASKNSFLLQGNVYSYLKFFRVIQKRRFNFFMLFSRFSNKWKT